MDSPPPLNDSRERVTPTPPPVNTSVSPACMDTTNIADTNSPGVLSRGGPGRWSLREPRRVATASPPINMGPSARWGARYTRASLPSQADTGTVDGTSLSSARSSSVGLSVSDYAATATTDDLLERADNRYGRNFIRPTLRQSAEF